MKLIPLIVGNYMKWHLDPTALILDQEDKHMDNNGLEDRADLDSSPIQHFAHWGRQLSTRHSLETGIVRLSSPEALQFQCLNGVSNDDDHGHVESPG